MFFPDLFHSYYCTVGPAGIPGARGAGPSARVLEVRGLRRLIREALTKGDRFELAAPLAIVEIVRRGGFPDLGGAVFDALQNTDRGSSGVVSFLVLHVSPL